MDLNNIISKIYVITKSDKKLKTIINRFNKVGKNKIKANITKYEEIDSDRLTEEQIEGITTPMCSQLCSTTTISQWLSHYNLWKNIVKNNEDNVLILENNVAPSNNFYEMLEEYWKEVPNDWDMIYFGCTGSCDSSVIKDTTYRIFKNRINTPAQKENKEMVFVMEPGYPLGIYGYMLSLKGAKKLLADDNLKKVNFGLDYSLAKNIIDSDDFKAYSFKPPLIFNVKDPVPEKDIRHSINKPITSNINLSDKQSLGDLEEYPVYHIRKLGIDVTYSMVLLMIVSFLIGYNNDDKLKKVYITTITFLQVIEMAYTKTSFNKLKNLLFELIVIIGILFLGSWIRLKKISKE